MEVKFAVQQAPRELVVEVNDDAEAIEKTINEAVASDGLIALTDTKGRRVLVPSKSLAFVEIGSSVTGQVGFRS